MGWAEDRKIRQEMVDLHRRIYELGFSVANDGNSSVRLDSKTILITPMGLNKAKLEPQQLVTMDMDGNPAGSGTFAPSSEKYVHVAIYRLRPDVQAIVHAHPPFAIACSLAGVSLASPVLPEVILTLGQIPTVPYSAPSTKEFGDLIAEQAKKYDALILDRHGAVTMGKTLDDAFQKMERLEHTAKIEAIARSMGAVTPLPKPEVDKLMALSHPNQRRSTDVKTSTISDIDPKLIELITLEVKAALKRQD